MAFYCLGPCFFNPVCMPCTRCMWKCGMCTAMCCTFGLVGAVCAPTIKAVEGILYDEKLARTAAWTPDLFGSALDDLKRKHKKVRPKMCKKYGIDYGLGMEDDEVKERLEGLKKDEWELWWEDVMAGIHWLTPSIMNATCCCCCDMTHLSEKLGTGEAYKAGCCSCSLFFRQAGVGIEPFKPRVGRTDEFIIIISCPGDHHKWITQDGFRDDESGNVHTTFEQLANQSDGTVLFCPVQMGKKDKDGNLLPPEELETNELKRDYYVSRGDDDPEFNPNKNDRLDLWKAYWMSKVKRAIVDVKRKKELPVRKVTFVAILGGGTGSEFERSDVFQPLDELFKGREKVQEAMDVFIDNVMCVMSCGCTQCSCVGGITSWLTGLKLAAGRLTFCTPVKNLKMGMKIVYPNELECFLKDPSVAELEDYRAVALKGVLLTQKAPQEQLMQSDKKI